MKSVKGLGGSILVASVMSVLPHFALAAAIDAGQVVLEREVSTKATAVFPSLTSDEAIVTELSAGPSGNNFLVEATAFAAFCGLLPLKVVVNADQVRAAVEQLTEAERLDGTNITREAFIELPGGPNEPLCQIVRTEQFSIHLGDGLPVAKAEFSNIRMQGFMKSTCEEAFKTFSENPGVF